MLAQNLDDVLSFVAESLRRDEKPIFRIADYTAGLSYHEAELRGLEGLEINVRGRNGHVSWLKIARLIKEPPPSFPRTRGTDVASADQLFANEKWVTIPDDPTRVPTLANSIRIWLPLASARALVEKKRIDRGDYGEANATGRVMTTLSLEHFPETRTMYEDWLQHSWTPWTEREKPRRQSIAFYDELFKVHAAISGRDAALEIVVGVGQVRGNLCDHDLDHPLVEYRAEIVIDPSSATISIAPKDDLCDIFQFPAEDHSGAAELMNAARTHWAGLPENCDISPFERLHWEPILQAASSYLGSSGRYEQLSIGRALPSVTSGFAIFDSWVLLVRPSSLRPLLIDVAQMQEELRKAEALDPLIVLLDNPMNAEQLTQGMVDRVADLVRAATATVAVHGESGPGSGQCEVSVAPYFPKLSNQDQEKIIRILERRESKGLVVQGPPGTGKSHSIANILCHGLACGWRILVAAHSDGPLQVLKGMLPPELQNLAINLSSSEQPEVSQLEESVKAIATSARRVDDQASHVRRIEKIEERIVANRVRLVQISEAFLGWARENLEYNDTYGGRLTAASLAELIVKDGYSNTWFDDVIPLVHLVPPVDEPEIGRLRALRARLGSNLQSYEWRLPEDAALPDEDAVVRVHAALIQGKRLSECEPSVAIRHLAGLVDGRDQAVRMRERLEEIMRSLDVFSSRPWLSAWFADYGRSVDDQRLSPAILEIVQLALPLIAKEKEFVLNQVVVPKRPPGMKAAVEKAIQSDKPYSKLPFFRPSADIVDALDVVHVRGQHPTREGWKVVLEYLVWVRAIEVAAERWNALAEMFSLPRCDVQHSSALTWFKQTVEHVRIARDLDDRLLRNIDRDTATLAESGLHRSQILTDAAHLESTRALLKNWHSALVQRISQIDVAWAVAKHREMTQSVEPYSGPTAKTIQAVLATLGSETQSEREIGERWRDTLAALREARALYASGRELAGIAQKLELSGAVNWAKRIKTIPRSGDVSEIANIDPIIPPDWKEAWVWSVWKAKLEANKSLAGIKSLLAEKASIDEELIKLMNSVVVLRTELQLSRLPKPVLTKLALFQDAVQRTGSGTGVRAARLRKEAKKLAAECYGAVPCWIMPIKKVAETQPSKLGMFDLVIIDEASQCGPEAIPVIMRGKKVLIVGDDKQVSPTSFMSEESYRQLHARFLASSPYRSALSPGASMYSLGSAMFAGDNVRLREHFRCVEPIIRFSMRFYGSDASTGLIPLRIPKPSERLDPPVVDIYVPHGIARGKKNRAEAEVIATQIRDIASDPRYDGRTIGVISLNGAEQAAVIEREIMERLGPEVFTKYELLVADSSGFQGKERSIMFLSMVDAPNRKTSARVQDIYAQRYNVALSRARDRMFMVHSIKLDSLNNPRDLRRLALQHFVDPMPTEVARRQRIEDLMEKCDSGFERDVLSRLLRDGFDANPQFPAAGYKIDIVVDGTDDKRLAIELDGDVYHPPEQYAKDMERQQQLERIGFKFWRCWWSDWILAPDSCYADLVAMLDSLGIAPIVGTRRPKANYCASYVADEEGKLLTPEEHARRQTEPTEAAHAGSHVTVLEGEYSEVANDLRPARHASGQLVMSNLYALPKPATASNRLRPGDMIVVQIANLNDEGDCRTRNIEIRAGDEDNLDTGRVGLNSPLGKMLSESLVDDCFEFWIGSREVALTVLAIRRAA